MALTVNYCAIADKSFHMKYTYRRPVNGP